MQNVASSAALEEALRPPPVEVALRIGVAGLLFAGGAAVLEFAGDGFDSVRGFGAVAGLILGGVGLSRRPDRPGLWLLASVVALVASRGFPAAWDSMRMMATVVAVVALIGAVMCALPSTLRWVIASVVAVAHFGGILTAVTGPPPQPYVSGQMWHYVYRPYLQFMYLNNAYQFYSPEPGPSVVLWARVKYKTDNKEERYRWFRSPERPAQMYDPLALSYYRRIALTERLNTPGSIDSIAEQKEVDKRRQFARYAVPGQKNEDGTPRTEVLPYHPSPPVPQYMPPNRDVRMLILPSYAQHIATEMAIPGGPEVESVSLYRVVHRMLNPNEVGRELTSPYEPSGYLPFFYGEYDPAGKLLDPKDPMLYSLLPIVRTTAPGAKTPEPFRYRPADYVDYVERHAGSPHGGFNKHAESDQGGTK